MAAFCAYSTLIYFNFNLLKCLNFISSLTERRILLFTISLHIMLCRNSVVIIYIIITQKHVYYSLL